MRTPLAVAMLLGLGGEVFLHNTGKEGVAWGFIGK